MASGRRDHHAGERVKTIRQSRHLTQDQLARAAGVSRSLVAQWETGRSGFSRKAVQLARVLEVPVGMLQLDGLIEDDVDPDQVNEDEAVILDAFRRLQHDDQARLLHLVRRLSGAR